MRARSLGFAAARPAAMVGRQMAALLLLLLPPRGGSLGTSLAKDDMRTRLLCSFVFPTFFFIFPGAFPSPSLLTKF